MGELGRTLFLFLEKRISDYPVHLIIGPIKLVGFRTFEPPTTRNLLHARDIYDSPIGIKLPGDQILRVIEIQPFCFVQLAFFSRLLDVDGSLGHLKPLKERFAATLYRSQL